MLKQSVVIELFSMLAVVASVIVVVFLCHCNFWTDCDCCFNVCRCYSLSSLFLVAIVIGCLGCSGVSSETSMCN